VEQELIHNHPMADKVIRRRKSRSESVTSTKSKIDPFSHEGRTVRLRHFRKIVPGPDE